MNSSLDALDMYFNEIVNDQCSSANTILSHLLGRQSLTEVDHNRGLKDALQLAKECKSLLHTEFYAEAIVVFVKAFATSAFCLESLEDVTEKLVSALNLVLHNHMRLHGNQAMPRVCKAAKLIMLGFNMVPVPPFEEVCELITGTCAPYQEWRQHESLHRLNTHQLTWVKLLAGFRSSYRLALHCTRDRHRRIYRHWDAFADQARECLSGVDMAYDLHPFVLQATVQLAMLLETPDDALVLHWDAMQETEGYETAVKTLGDPALAVNHLVQTMFTNLQATYGIPNCNEKRQLKRAANRIMQCIDVLQSDPYVWDSVRGSTLATLFRLAQTWDLYLLLDCSLKNGVHSLVSFIHDQHSMQRELLLRPEPSPEPTFEELAQGLEEMSSLVDRLPADTRRNDDREFIDLRCTRCERRINTKSEAMECQLCHSAFYCSPDCQKKHAQSHKGPCKRAKLKAKLAAKPSTK